LRVAGGRQQQQGEVRLGHRDAVEPDGEAEAVVQVGRAGRLTPRVRPRALRRVAGLAAASLPRTLPQLVLALALLLLGVVAGRASRGERPPLESPLEYEGTGRSQRPGAVIATAVPMIP
jgi:hypothetical protein